VEITRKAGEGKPAWNIDELKERMKRFGLAIIRLVEKMPGARAAAVVSNQMVRAGTSAGANYRSACRARSRADFIAKMGINAAADLASYAIRTGDLVQVNSAFGYSLGVRHSEFDPPANTSRMRLPS